MDQRHPGRAAPVGPESGDRPVGHALFLTRFGLCGGHLIPLGYERLLADGRHRVWRRQAAARAGGRQHSRSRGAGVSRPVEAHRQRHAQKTARHRPKPGRPGHPPEAANRAHRFVRPLRDHVCHLGRRQTAHAALLHRGVQQHIYVQAGVRLHRRVRAPRHRRRHAGQLASVSKLQRKRPAPGTPAHLVD